MKNAMIVGTVLLLICALAVDSMSMLNAGSLGVMAAAFLACAWYWNRNVRRYPLSFFGTDMIRWLLEVQTGQRREEVLQRGWLTGREYLELLETSRASTYAKQPQRDMQLDETGGTN